MGDYSVSQPCLIWSTNEMEIDGWDSVVERIILAAHARLLFNFGQVYLRYVDRKIFKSQGRKCFTEPMD